LGGAKLTTPPFCNFILLPSAIPHPFLDAVVGHCYQLRITGRKIAERRIKRGMTERRKPELLI
jgi:hypothetical protein